MPSGLCITAHMEGAAIPKKHTCSRCEHLNGGPCLVRHGKEREKSVTYTRCHTQATALSQSPSALLLSAPTTAAPTMQYRAVQNIHIYIGLTPAMIQPTQSQGLSTTTPPPHPPPPQTQHPLFTMSLQPCQGLWTATAAAAVCLQGCCCCPVWVLLQPAGSCHSQQQRGTAGGAWGVPHCWQQERQQCCLD
jgi:hypothetical protein